MSAESDNKKAPHEVGSSPIAHLKGHGLVDFIRDARQCGIVSRLYRRLSRIVPMRREFEVSRPFQADSTISSLYVPTFPQARHFCDTL
jgi:hypothetical protein